MIKKGRTHPSESRLWHPEAPCSSSCLGWEAPISNHLTWSPSIKWESPSWHDTFFFYKSTCLSTKLGSQAPMWDLL